MAPLRTILAALSACAAICALATQSVSAADVSLTDAINCSDFTHNPDGSWYAKSASLNYGPDSKIQLNLHHTTITAKDADLFAALNQKCGTGH
jgi:hypothetical protein